MATKPVVNCPKPKKADRDLSDGNHSGCALPQAKQQSNSQLADYENAGGKLPQGEQADGKPSQGEQANGFPPDRHDATGPFRSAGFRTSTVGVVQKGQAEQPPVRNKFFKEAERVF